MPDWKQFLPSEETNIAKAFKSAGCATVSIGKWHLGPGNSFPDRVGFDQNFGGYDRTQPPRDFAPYQIPTLAEQPRGEFLTDRESVGAQMATVNPNHDTANDGNPANDGKRTD